MYNNVASKIQNNCTLVCVTFIFNELKKKHVYTSKLYRMLKRNLYAKKVREEMG